MTDTCLSASPADPKQRFAAHAAADERRADDRCTAVATLAAGLRAASPAQFGRACANLLALTAQFG